jgi:hypothetical protein
MNYHDDTPSWLTIMRSTERSDHRIATCVDCGKRGPDTDPGWDLVGITEDDGTEVTHDICGDCNAADELPHDGDDDDITVGHTRTMAGW